MREWLRKVWKKTVDVAVFVLFWGSLLAFAVLLFWLEKVRFTI